jgi:uncharacterized protein
MAATPLVTEAFQTFLTQRVSAFSPRSIQAVLKLHADGNTVPFIARYRKEKTGKLDEVEIRAILDCYQEFNEVVHRKQYVLAEIEKQGNLTDELKKRIEIAMDLAEIEELFRPYKRKKKTKATLAREGGLGPFSDWLWALGHGESTDSTSLEVKAKEFINAAAGFVTYDEVIQGAQNILVERLSNVVELRAAVRDELSMNGRLVAEKTKDFKPHSKYETYQEYSEPVKNLMTRKASHRYLAVRRGWQEGELKVVIQGDEARLLKLFESAILQKSSQADAFLKTVAKTALTVHVLPSITNEIHSNLKESADRDAIHVFAENVRRLLMASPFGAKTVLGVDPGLRTGCKVALVDKNGHFISHTVVHILGEDAKEKAKKLFEDVFRQVKIDAVAIGNGTAGRETEKFFRDILKELNVDTPVVLVNESGASVYSASDVAREEFPDLDLTVRGAISISRRLQDPLAELVKIEPKSIGVGQYQHDVAQSPLKKSLHEVVESCVNQVGVDLNTASESLLQYIAGIGPATAKSIINHRKEKGLFQERSELLKVAHFSTKVYEQAAGFLRVMNGKMVLDSTGVHPERYAALRDMATEVGVPLLQLVGPGSQKLLPVREKWSKLIGEYTFDDIIRELEKPGRDPRDPYKIFKFREDIHELKDLKAGMICPGLVTNVTNFGAFVDIGVHQDGLVHISELSQQFVEDPRLVVSPGHQVQVRVLNVDLDKKQISLSMILEEAPPREATPRPRPQAPRPRPPSREARSGGGEQTQQRGGPARPRPPRDGAQPARNHQQRDSRQGGGPRREDRPAKQPFNNPFAALTTINKNR